ncbi:Aspartyl/glutamyl-tRNA(Asn/Gln) amidotransferase subunit C [Candidatus Trichorickettsia mobilis]|uniref:Aspartyl/glutamyl-tRNA(Asn/Gln) amidotransferase subunit C n=1 Tax=Candidatus Trichorickettsia mobilis TaxID=1346319 RepID=A0ABZ0UXX7_9RICK|nr:Asp-tRNA(Asn)/Glu-tRNA(Gln) amidotransferase subunit GatC [Candidatus Trichorickettsia mobilis]WPY00914.1 Aspartyl/glutamyl-tRNA(Asn/Gln) amidotransferase subunit C [Candidatus Trichorickettsia mobilis]
MITPNDVTKIAKLAKLHFTTDEITNFAKELTEIMEMIDTLNEVDCSNITPLTSACDITPRMRQDVVTSASIADELFANVPDNNANFAKEIKCYIVPKILE